MIVIIFDATHVKDFRLPSGQTFCPLSAQEAIDRQRATLFARSDKRLGARTSQIKSK
jgi:hypothetical protein